MAITNVSTFGALQSLLQNMSQTQNDLNNDQVAISSGHKSQTFDGMTGTIEQFTSLNAQVIRLNDYQQSNSIYTSQLQASNTVLGQMVQVVTNIKSLISSQMSGTSSASSFHQQLQSDLDTLTSQLNTASQGNYLFGGTGTSAPPVQVPLPAPAQIGVPDNSYYQGTTQDTSVRIADGQSITNTVRADDPAFQNIIAGIQQALQPNVKTSDLKNAENLIDTGLQGVISLQAAVNGNIVSVQQVTTQNQTLQTYFSGIVSTLSQSDVISLSTKVAQDQSVLQASFATFARISSLSLANYLK